MSWRWGTSTPLVAVIYCDHHERARSAFYDDDAPSCERCPACGGMIVPPPPPDQSQPVEVRGL